MFTCINNIPLTYKPYKSITYIHHSQHEHELVTKETMSYSLIIAQYVRERLYRSRELCT